MPPGRDGARAAHGHVDHGGAGRGLRCRQLPVLGRDRVQGPEGPLARSTGRSRRTPIAGELAKTNRYDVVAQDTVKRAIETLGVSSPLGRARQSEPRGAGGLRHRGPTNRNNTIVSGRNRGLPRSTTSAAASRPSSRCGRWLTTLRASCRSTVRSRRASRPMRERQRDRRGAHHRRHPAGGGGDRAHDGRPAAPERDRS